MMMEKNEKYEDGYIEINGINLYYKRFGKGNRHKILALHGGPGGTHDYLLPLADLADRDYDIVFYDQFGCGNSDNPKSEGDYTLDYAIEEVEAVRSRFFVNGKINLFGNSWGGMLALAYAIKYQEHLLTVISSSGLSSVPETVKEMKRLISLMPEKYKNAINDGEKLGDYGSAAYKEADEYFMKNHTLRIYPYPPEVIHLMEMTEKRGTYLKMNGPSEFTIIGTIKDIDFTEDLHKIHVPTLITCGLYDEVTPKIAEDIHSRIKKSEMLIFRNSSHLQFWEERSEYMDAIDRFIKRHDF